MKSISFSDLPNKLGINPLTGEACAFSMRVLCDLNEEGAALVREYFGMPYDAKLSANWNSMVADKPSVASIMLPREVFPGLVRFALFRIGFQYLVGQEDAVAYSGFNDADVTGGYAGLSLYLDGTSAMLKQNGGHLVVWRNPRNPAASVGTRNVHQFTGRSD